MAHDDDLRELQFHLEAHAAEGVSQGLSPAEAQRRARLVFGGVSQTNEDCRAVAIESTRLPGTPRRDPADRILIATARLIGATLVTCDKAILDYAADGHVRVLDARPRR